MPAVGQLASSAIVYRERGMFGRFAFNYGERLRLHRAAFDRNRRPDAYTRADLPSHDVRRDLVGRDPHGIKIEKFTSPLERYL
jgi:hypothetical protein